MAGPGCSSAVLIASRVWRSARRPAGPGGAGDAVLTQPLLVPGHFGENLTVEGMPDDEVCVGDRYRIGDAVFEVTRPRVTCYKVGLRLGKPRMPALLYSHGRPGFYLRVLRRARSARAMRSSGSPSGRRR